MKKNWEFFDWKQLILGQTCFVGFWELTTLKTQFKGIKSDDKNREFMKTHLENSDKVKIFRAARVYRLPARQDWPVCHHLGDAHRQQTNN